MFVTNFRNFNLYNNSTHKKFPQKTMPATFVNQKTHNGPLALKNYSSYMSSIKTSQRKIPYIQNEFIMRQSSFEPVISVVPKLNNTLKALNLKDYLGDKEYPIENNYVSKLEVKLCTKSTTLKSNRNKFQNPKEIRYLPNERSIVKSNNYRRLIKKIVYNQSN